VVVALAAIDAAAVVAKVTPGLKWPNDLVVGEAKLAGILAEVQPPAPGTPGPPAVVVGIGMNVSWPGPPDVAGISLGQAAGRPVERDELAEALLDALAQRRGDLDDPGGRQRMVGEARARCVTLGRTVRVDLGSRSVHGRAVDVTDQGHLVLEGADGPILVAAGDVVHLRPGSASEDWS